LLLTLSNLMATSSLVEMLVPASVHTAKWRHSGRQTQSLATRNALVSRSSRLAHTFPAAHKGTHRSLSRHPRVHHTCTTVFVRTSTCNQVDSSLNYTSTVAKETLFCVPRDDRAERLFGLRNKGAGSHGRQGLRGRGATTYAPRKMSPKEPLPILRPSLYLLPTRSSILPDLPDLPDNQRPAV